MGISAKEIGKMVGEALYAELVKRQWPMDQTAAMGITWRNSTPPRSGPTARPKPWSPPASRKPDPPGALRGLAEVSTAFDAANIVLTQQAAPKHWLVFGMNDEAVLGGVRALEGRGFKADDIIGLGIGGTTGLVDWE